MNSYFGEILESTPLIVARVIIHIFKRPNPRSHPANPITNADVILVCSLRTTPLESSLRFKYNSANTFDNCNTSVDIILKYYYINEMLGLGLNNILYLAILGKTKETVASLHVDSFQLLLGCIALVYFPRLRFLWKLNIGFVMMTDLNHFSL